MELKDMLIIVKHPEKGDAENGKTVCGEIRHKIAGSSGPLCLYHDATGMATANAGYAGEFKKLDKDLADRVVEVVCAIPGSIPRMMAHTVAMFSSKKWSIFKERAEAIKYLNAAGYALTEEEITKAETVSVKEMVHHP
jgi:hypothetical protein